MLHPVLESLFFLKIARTHITESIMSSDVDSPKELVNYIQNEASDYEIMHLITIGEMPEQKFDPVSEQAVWAIFRKGIVMNTNTLKESVLPEDIMTMVYEMGPVSELGYSSAAPILEFSRANGSLSAENLNEWDPPWQKSKMQQVKDTANKVGAKVKDSANTAGTKVKGYAADAGAAANKVGTSVKGYAADAGQSIGKVSGTVSKFAKDNKGGIASAAVGAAALYGLYKLYKNWKAKKAAATTPEAKAAADKQMAKIQTKIKAKKATA